ncbi:MAG: RNase adapter RapZ, partial [Bacteroidota bacterium]|nr:RNase adapter RapZ [Bacteroidota bacterium]
YFRIQGTKESVVGVINDDRKENDAFLNFSIHFRAMRLPVPEILATHKEQNVYILQDLGDITLFSRLSALRKEGQAFPAEIVNIYKKAIEWLPRFQIIANRKFNYSKCYPRAAFDLQSMMWDLNYFKYYFLKLAHVGFDEQKLEDDFHGLTAFLMKADLKYFMYRDFQSRNIMLVNNQPWFIDYQGGRKGPLQYDIASLLYDAKADIPEIIRTELLETYLSETEKYIHFNRNEFLELYYGFVLIRILQALGAYGFRGFYENKPHFLQSIPYALKNIDTLLKENKFPSQVPVLKDLFEKIVTNPAFQDYRKKENNLLVTVTSFSYKKGIPEDHSGNGGGFTFDCRALPNPGRLEEFKTKTGIDREVVAYLIKEQAVRDFMNHSFALVDQSIRNYIDRGFTNLSVNFGCTGGQHRSVFFAGQLAQHLRQDLGVSVKLIHTEMEKITGKKEY